MCLSFALHCVSAVRDLKHHSFCALMEKLTSYEERRGGGYKQRETRRKLEEKPKLQQSSLGQPGMFQMACLRIHGAWKVHGCGPS